MENWGFRFKELRKKHKLSQYEIGRFLEKDVTQISRYETGNGAKTLSRNLKRILNVVFTDDEIAYIEKGGDIPTLSKKIAIQEEDEDMSLVTEELKKLKGKDKINAKTILIQLTAMSTEQINKVLMNTIQINMEGDKFKV